MQTLLRDSLRSAFSSALLILKYVVPFYLLADILDHFDLLRHLGFLFAPLRLRPSKIRKVGSTAAGRLAAGGGAAAAKNEAGSSSTGITATQAPIPRSRNE